MILSDETSIKKHIKSNSPLRLYLVYGDESYLAEFYAKQLAASITDINGASFNYFYYEAENADFNTVYESAETLPVMSDKLLIMIKDLPFNKMLVDDVKQFTDYFPNIPETTTIIFLMSSVEVDTKTAKWKNLITDFDKNGGVFNLSKRSDNSVADLLVRSASKRNAVISHETAMYFVETVGNDLTVLLNEFDKLCSFAGESEISTAMIDEISTKSVEASVFDLTKAIGGKNSDRAFEILRDLIRQKTEATLIIGVLASEYIDLYRVKSAELNRASTSEISAVFNYKGKEFRLRNAQRTASSMTMEQIKSCVDAIAKADMRIKTFSVNPIIILEELLAKIIWLSGKRA